MLKDFGQIRPGVSNSPQAYHNPEAYKMQMYHQNLKDRSNSMDNGYARQIHPVGPSSRRSNDRKNLDEPWNEYVKYHST